VIRIEGRVIRSALETIERWRQKIASKSLNIFGPTREVSIPDKQ
jgi:hypothetical protein